MNSARWFDENGKEIIKERANLDESECVAEIGGIFEEFSVGVNFYSNKLNKQEITELLGVEPTKSWNPNERHSVGNSNKTRITNWGKWYLSSKRDKTDLNVKLTNLLQSLTTDLDKWKILTSKYEAWIDVAGYMENWNRGFTLNPEIMKMLSDRNLKIEFDIYYYSTEDENED
ncbi:hypothetical protein FLJC2902T_31990 [Flavobacterium limnosediminis JC2902]|uniref:DUF4279 domain-containing protein n=1 Tax=Flavobacterium limnosediminis JC2902 TaxID=1341181 RepID=V6SDK2_9FLAO|nr:DUF4279 domain-containing protein [Flavobacterium limnosediminis]ESU24559.1 hypothetical protein FLJC2902T_31990 [Flavobacterium limnosediminis JC2902]